MNYLKIVLDGLLNPNTNKYLNKYFYRELQKAIKDFYDPIEFFDGCFSVLESFENNIESEANKRRHELYLMLDQAKKETNIFSESGNQEPGEKRIADTIKICKEELARTKEDFYNDYNVNLNQFTGGLYYGKLYFKNISWIKTNLNLAKRKYETENAMKSLKIAMQKRKDKGKEKPQHNIKFNKFHLLFADISQSQEILTLLANKNLIEPNTNIWNKSNSNKSILADLIKRDLHVKGYYKDNIAPSTEEVVTICKNSFGIEVSESTVKHSSGKGKRDLNFIPYK